MCLELILSHNEPVSRITKHSNIGSGIHVRRIFLKSVVRPISNLLRYIKKNKAVCMIARYNNIENN